ncbi:MAG: Shikimate 5-dehydrogenase I alpha [uncultured Friedmanniella sp.]|uniref:Shikimate 5-dehydrogenase I alpha n=1 Tax=uncultured Friedmanniella sp. TaxID=335381 RepID=A0A6J4KE53_9ACTN|nr:shikimate dehydrogenase [uncultured Friedmanniella sp.]CAA9302282.1 MAG: Shikimate 5-dehydrogenase I alpha [uncultured Friedmanniella sp.]
MTAEAGRRRCAVLGSPIAHSLSPALHRAAYAELGLDWSYDRFEVVEDGLAGFVAGCDETWRGLSLTMPLKAVALDLGEVDPLAAQVGAANTLLFEADGSRRLHNTDVGGLVWALGRVGVTAVDRATLLGAGATARSTLVSLSRLGAREVTVLARTPARAVPLVALGDSLGMAVTVRSWTDPLPGADVVLNTAVTGAADALAEAAAASAPVVFDAIYDPWPTRLAEAAAAAGCAVVNGLDLLVGQALLQIELMTGRSVSASTLEAAGRAALARSAPD